MTRLELSNMAIALLGGVPMVTWGESTINGTLAAQHLPFALKQVLRVAPWPETTYVLALDENDITDEVYENTGMSYAYSLPVDILHLQEVAGKKTGWKYIDNVLHTNSANPTILYIASPGSDSIPDDVGHVTAYLLAFYMAPTITQDPNKPLAILQTYTMMMQNEKARIEQQLGDIDESPGFMTDGLESNWETHRTYRRGY